MSKDLRTFIASLQEDHPKEIVRVARPVDPSWEIAAVVRKFQAENQFPTIVFENVTGFEMPVMTNLFASRRKMAAALDVPLEETLNEYMRREDQPFEPQWVDDGPVKECRWVGEEADLSRLPIVTHGEKDAGPYINPGVGIAKDPDTGSHNAGIYRLLYRGPRKLGIDIGPDSHLAHILRKREEKGEDLEFAVALGHHPAFCHGSQARGALGADEFAVIGGLLGEPLELVKGETVDLGVPARAEIVIEGRILAGVREEEGPMGEFTWHYGPARQNPIFQVTAITHRRDAIFLDLNNLYLDHNYLGLLGRESNLYKRVKEVIPSMRSVAVAESGGCRLTGFIQIHKEYEGQGKNAALAALAADPYMKLVVVVDEDVDIYSDREVMWAVTTRTQPDRDFFFIPGSFVCIIDPSGHTGRSRNEHGGMNTRVGIDASRPVDIPFPERCDVKRELWEGIDLAEYLPSEVGVGNLP